MLARLLLCLICLAGLIGCQSAPEHTVTLVLELDPVEGETAIDREAQTETADIIRDRLDRLGVRRLEVRTEGKRRVLVTFAGDEDPKRYVDLVGRTATLEFRFVRPAEETAMMVAALDSLFRGRDEVAEPPAESDDPFDPLPGSLTDDDRARLVDHPLGARLTPSPWGSSMLVPDSQLEIVREMLADPRARVVAKSRALWFSTQPEIHGDAEPMHSLYVLDPSPALTGREIAKAEPRPDTNRPGNWMINIELTPRGGRLFARLTGDNVGRFLAICLDRKVVSAPRINGRVPGGSAVLEGTFTLQEAQDLALTLQSGSLPAVVRVVEVRTG